MAVTIHSFVAIATDLYQIVGTGTPVNNSTGAGISGPGSTYFDDATGRQYINAGTKAAPTWTLIVNSPNGVLESAIASAALTGLGLVRFAKAQYNYLIDGGAVGAVVPVANATIPIKAIILGGVVDVVTAPTSGGAATIALGTSAGSSATSLKAATGYATYAGISMPIVPVFTAATIIKLTAAGQIQLTVATAALTAGLFNVIVAYLVGD